MPAADARLERWLAATTPAGAADSTAALAEVRSRLDDDLDTPGAVAAIDAAVARGEGVASAAALLGVFLVGDPVT
jgi:L-cysteine:1D-myo-inositol 2-amino-2-deoxy-alpha-D-glucopyranoside ligase